MKIVYSICLSVLLAVVGSLSASAQEISASAQELAANAQALEGVVGQFRL